MGHIERKQREKENIRNKILQAALDIARFEGWQGVTIRKIADAIEYTTSIVYGNFGSKEAVLQQIIDDGFASLFNQSVKAMEKEADPRKQLMALSLVNWDFAVKNWELCKLMFSLDRPPSREAEKMLPMIREIFILLSEKPEKELNSLILNWLCLQQGAICRLRDIMEHKNIHCMNPSKAIMTQLKGIVEERSDADIYDMKKFYVEFVERFISSVSN